MSKIACEVLDGSPARLSIAVHRDDGSTVLRTISDADFLLMESDTERGLTLLTVSDEMAAALLAVEEPGDA